MIRRIFERTALALSAIFILYALLAVPVSSDAAAPLSGDVSASDMRRDFIAKLIANATAGNPITQYDLAMMYLDGTDEIKQSDSEAAVWMERSAIQGYPQAQYQYGVMLEEGWGVKKDMDEAQRWFRRAALQDHPEACLTLGFYAFIEDPPNYEEGLEWFLKVSSHPMAQAYIGRMYMDGKYLKKNDEEAAKWFRLAAEQDFHDAQFIMGYLYEHGQGVPKDEHIARQWMERAAANGSDDAAEWLAEADKAKSK